MRSDTFIRFSKSLLQEPSGILGTSKCLTASAHKLLRLNVALTESVNVSLTRCVRLSVRCRYAPSPRHYLICRILVWLGAACIGDFAAPAAKRVSYRDVMGYHHSSSVTVRSGNGLLLAALSRFDERKRSSDLAESVVHHSVRETSVLIVGFLAPAVQYGCDGGCSVRVTQLGNL